MITRFIISLLLLISLTAATSAPVNVPISVTISTGSNDEEFTGPLSNWINAKTGKRVDGTGSAVCTGSTGDGSTDDFATLQTCLTALSSTVPALYLPAGTYRITHAVALIGGNGLMVVGHDPSDTIVKWDGAGGTVASFTGTISGIDTSISGVYKATLTVSGVTGSILPGQLLSGAGIVVGTATIVKDTGGGTYQISGSAISGLVTAGPEAMTTTDQSILYWGGTSFSQLSRITFNGQSLIAIGLDVDWPAGSTNFTDSNVFSDDVIENTGMAFRCGWAGGCANISVLRTTFQHNTVAGISMKNFNALSMWIWYCNFINNGASVNNADSVSGGAGTFFLYGNKFQGSTVADVQIGNPHAFVLKGNYSIGSQRFLSSGGSAGSGTIVVQSNTILDTVSPTAVLEQDLGPMTLLDNVIRNSVANSPSATAVAGVGNGDSIPGDILSMGNTFTNLTAACGSAIVASGAAGRCHSVQDQVVSRGTINPSAPVLPATPANLSRAVFEASPTGSGGADCQPTPCTPQHAIDLAAASGDPNPIVHLAVGSYSLSTTITVPASRHMQIVGDGGHTQLAANGGLTGPNLKLLGPSRVTLRNFGVLGLGNAHPGIEIDGVDASGNGGLVFGESLNLSNSNPNLYANGIDYSTVEMHNFQYNFNTAGDGATVVGGGAHGGSVNMYFGTAAGNLVGISQSGTARTNVMGVWNEVSGSTTSGMSIAGSGAFSYAGSNVTTTKLNTAALVNFTGKAAFVGLLHLCPCNNGCNASGLLSCDNYGVSGSASGGKVLGAQIAGATTNFWLDTTSPSDSTEFLLGQYANTSQISEINDSPPNTSFLTDTLALMRSNVPTVPAALAPSQTDVRLYSILVSNASRGIDLEP